MSTAILRGFNPDIPEEEILWGMNEKKTNEEVTEKAFALAGETGHFNIATVENGQPRTRVISIQRLNDGRLLFMTSKGKPFYQQLLANPQIAAGASIQNWYSLRINAHVVEVTDDKAIFDEYIASNPGTASMYRNSLDLISLFLLDKGWGEMFHLYDSDHIRRMRFGFGGVDPDPMPYYISAEDCTGCGTCFDNCAEEAIYQTEDGKYFISAQACDICGICYPKCPLMGKALRTNIKELQ